MIGSPLPRPFRRAALGLACFLALTPAPRTGFAQSGPSRAITPRVGTPSESSRSTPDASGAVIAPHAASAPPASERSALAPPSGPTVNAVLASRSFTYQGLLRGSGLPITGTADLEFSLWDDPAAGNQLGSTQTVSTSLNDGLFTVVLNEAGQFGGAFDGRALWVSIAVRSPGGSGSYTTLSPRQPLTAAPLASGLVPHATVNAGDTFSGYPVMNVTAPAEVWGNPMGLTVSAAAHSNYIGQFNSVGVWGDSGPGIGLWGTTNTGTGVMGHAQAGWAGQFIGDVNITGKLNIPRFHTVLALNSVGPLPLTSGSFTTSGGSLTLFYSGSGYSSVSNLLVGMNILLDGNFVDATGVFANNGGMHLAFVAKQWVLTGIAAGSHTITLSPLSGTFTDPNDIFNVTVTEMPY